MPYRIDHNKKENRFYLFKLNEKETIPIGFKTKEKAINQGKNWMRYRKENPIVYGNFILNKNLL